MLPNENLLTLSDADAVADAVAEIWIATANAAIATQGRFVACLPGGDTAYRLYDLLTQPSYSERVPWEQTLLLFADERSVDPEHPESNFGALQRLLLDRLPGTRPEVLRMQGELDHAARAAHLYEEAMRARFPGEELPRVDLLILGVGADGTTAALRPGSDALQVEDRWVTAHYLSEVGEWHLTLTLPVLRAAELTLFLITGEEKAQVVAEAFAGHPHDNPHPCERVVPVRGRREVFLDVAAAATCLASA